MTQDIHQAAETGPAVPLEVGPEAATPRQRAAWAVPAAALVVGLLVGGGVGAAIATSDPTTSEEYQALQGDLDEAEARVIAMSDAARKADGRAREAQEEAAQQRAALDEQAAEVAAREQAVAQVERQIAATSIGVGTWTVGVDVEPGTYRTSEPVLGDCYWGIYASGTNGSDIIENDIVQGGFPTVTLREGQDFENNRCGTFVKQ
ncbi:hypothetical protein [Blastococcus sp. VKM Ac-2987]|uniref:hypothetical protein n=1 Tax=Blastococcus sp. VKM Ac-2987 TaxID=3004141 RepID=UPI0022ABACAD|nr:hypothetical protein [Blastococcus sp. VKM Ac-2987]MCZ2857629.1 hypothetical protein [Blastococcus sp. VKM Ac-2987]